jgi:hypothetical protein
VSDPIEGSDHFLFLSLESFAFGSRASKGTVVEVVVDMGGSLVCGMGLLDADMGFYILHLLLLLPRRDI